MTVITGCGLIFAFDYSQEPTSGLLRMNWASQGNRGELNSRHQTLRLRYKEIDSTDLSTVLVRDSAMSTH